MGRNHRTLEQHLLHLLASTSAQDVEHLFIIRKQFINIIDGGIIDRSINISQCHIHNLLDTVRIVHRFMLQGREAVVHNLIPHIHLLLLVVDAQTFILFQFQQLLHLIHLVRGEIGMDAHELCHQIDDERLFVLQLSINEMHTHHTRHLVVCTWHEHGISTETSIVADHLLLLTIGRFHHALIHIPFSHNACEEVLALARRVFRRHHHAYRVRHLDVAEVLMQHIEQRLFCCCEDVVVQLNELPQIEDEQLRVAIVQEEISSQHQEQQYAQQDCRCLLVAVRHLDVVAIILQRWVCARQFIQPCEHLIIIMIEAIPVQ